MMYYVNVFEEYYRNSLGHVNKKDKCLTLLRNQYGVVKSSGRGQNTSTLL